MISIDGSQGEGGGQILRTSLSLSLVTGQPFCLHAIRARRPKPGLLRQHLTAVRAAAEIARAHVEGDELGSTDLSFRPASPRAGSYHFEVGTAGSTTLVLQTVLPALIVGREPSDLVLDGGTHNPMAPPFDFIEKTFLPLLSRMGARVEVRLEKAGFFPAGGGRIHVHVDPTEALTPLDLLDRGPIRRIGARAMVANLPRSIGERELRRAAELLGLAAGHDRGDLRVVELRGGPGPGNALILEIESASLTEVFTGFGERRVSAETVAERAATEARAYIEANVPVGTHLADQLLLPLALAGSGRFRTQPLSAHFTTNLLIVRKFLPVRLVTEPLPDGGVQVAIGDAAG